MNNPVIFKFEKFLFDTNKLQFNDAVIADRSKLGNCFMEKQMGFRFSQVLESMCYFYLNNDYYNNEIIYESILTPTKRYIIASAVQNTPVDWTDLNHEGHIVINKKSIFELLNKQYLEDLRNGNAILLIDQSVEGGSTPWLWNWFHYKCKIYNINPNAIIYLTGDQACIDSYQSWMRSNNQQYQLKIIPSTSLTYYLHTHYKNKNINPNFDDILKYKTNNKIYLFDCLNMRPRPQRIINFLHLLNAGLLDKGNVSMPDQALWKAHFDITSKWGIDGLTGYKLPNNIVSKLGTDKTPRSTTHTEPTNNVHYYEYVERILKDVYLNSWVSLVTESTFFKTDNSVFISEKTFKPIACMQPFIICGSKHSLKYLKKLGYKTFHPFIDESYDNADDANRFSAIIEAIKKIEQIKDKPKWYSSIRGICEHNHKLFLQIGSVKSKEHNEIFNYYLKYFEGKNV